MTDQQRLQMNLHLTWISDVKPWDYPSYLACFKSLKQHSGCQSVVLTDDPALSKKDTWHLFSDAGTTPTRISSLWHDPPKIENILRDRWLAFWRYIEPELHDYVVITDARDVIFQRDPFAFCERISEDRVILTGEGFAHKQSPFNLIDQFEAQRELGDFQIAQADWPVMNAGVLAGPADKVKQLCLTIWSNCLRCRGRCTDQGVFNYLCYYLRQDPVYYVANPNEDPWCITGEALKENLMDIEVVYQDGELRMNDKTPYFIFHQWDRTKYCEEILQKYGEGVKLPLP
jgi:hypothetical protein